MLPAPEVTALPAQAPTKMLKQPEEPSRAHPEPQASLHAISNTLSAASFMLAGGFLPPSSLGGGGGSQP